MVETLSSQDQNNIFSKISSTSSVELSSCETAFECENKDDSKTISSSSQGQINKSELEQEELNIRKIGEISAIESYVNNTTESDPFFVVDLNAVVNQFNLWTSKLPRFTPHYAVKCNNDRNVVKTLIALGTSFDCASLEEIKMILDLGVSPKKIIYANPCKAPKFIKFAAEKGINRMTFDNAEELYKVKEHHPEAELVIRIHVDDSKSICQFGVKFGVRLGNTRVLLELAVKLGLKVVGVSFHVGSGCTDSSAYADALRRARDIFEEAKEVGYEFTLLDIGGGFPGLQNVHDNVKIKFEEIADAVNQAYDECFANHKNLELIAEPGRFFTSSAFSLVTNITSRRTIETNEGTNYMYYLNDGVYGSFNCLIFDHAVLSYPRFLVKNESTGVFSHSTAQEMNAPLFNCSMWGPTCDSMDCLTKSMKMPQVSPGDWLIFDNMGAYTLVAASRFNGMNNPKAFYLVPEANALQLKPEYETPYLEDLRACLIHQKLVYS